VTPTQPRWPRALLFLATACAALPPHSRVDGGPARRVEGLSPRAVLDREDFNYAVAFSRDGRRLAHVHLAADGFHLAAWALDGPVPVRLSDAALCRPEWDVEGLDLLPGGEVAVAAGRDGVARFVQVEGGRLLGEFRAGEPLVSAAFGADGARVALGGARGTVTVLAWPGGAFLAEARLHADEVRALAFDAGGRLWSGGWDKALVQSEPVAGASPRTRVGAEETPHGWVVRASLGGRAPGRWLLDAGSPLSFVRGEPAGRGNPVVALPAPWAPARAPVRPGEVLSLGGWRTPPVDLVACDRCVPEELDGVLGAPALTGLRWTRNEALSQLEVERAAGEVSAAGDDLVLQVRALHALPSHVSDVGVSADGAWLAVALSERKAQRSLAVFEREQRGQLDQESEGNAVALVEAGTGRVVERWTAHRGVVSTVALSPDGKLVASGGWDKRLYLYERGQPAPFAGRRYGWSVRRVRFSPDGRSLGAAAWTPQNAVGDRGSDPALEWLGLRGAGSGVIR